MYVIFPADEVILLSYGITQNPSFQQRPSLDNIREPLGPSIGTRPSSNSNSNSVHKSICIHSDQTHRTATPSPKRDVSFADDFMYKSKSSLPDPSLLKPEDLSANGLDAKKKGTFKSRLSKISLGKLNRPSSSEQADVTPSRLREDLEIRVSNPTFTSANLRQKNFDAFFASGESIYSLEKREKSLIEGTASLTTSSLQTPLSPIDTNSSNASSSPVTPVSPGSTASQKSRKSSIAAFFTPKLSKKPPPAESSSRRPKSTGSAEDSVKGDRCQICKFW